MISPSPPRRDASSVAEPDDGWRKPARSEGACVQAAQAVATITGGWITGYTVVPARRPGAGAEGAVFRAGRRASTAETAARDLPEAPITLSRLKQIADAAADAATTELGIDANAPGPRPGPELDQYCLSVVEYLARELFPFPRGIKTGAVRDDGLIRAGQDARTFLGLPPAAWTPVTSWNALTTLVRDAGPGAAAFVVIGGPSRALHDLGGPVPAIGSHSIVFTHTTDQDVVLTDPFTFGRHDTRPVTDTGETTSGVPAEGFGPLTDTRALLVGPTGHLITAARTAAPRANPTVQALTDPADPRVGVSWMRRLGRRRYGAETPGPGTAAPNPQPPAAIPAPPDYTQPPLYGTGPGPAPRYGNEDLADSLMNAVIGSAGSRLPRNARTAREMRTLLADELQYTPRYQQELHPQVLTFLAEGDAGRYHRLGTRAWQDAVDQYMRTQRVDWDQIITDLRTPGSWNDIVNHIAPTLVGRVFNLRINVERRGRPHPDLTGNSTGYPIVLINEGLDWRPVGAEPESDWVTLVPWLRQLIDRTGEQGLSTFEIQERFPSAHFYGLVDRLGPDYEVITRHQVDYYRRRGLQWSEYPVAGPSGQHQETPAPAPDLQLDAVGLAAFRDRVDEAGEQGLSARDVLREFPIFRLVTASHQILDALGPGYEEVVRHQMEYYRRRGIQRSDYPVAGPSGRNQPGESRRRHRPPDGRRRAHRVNGRGAAEHAVQGVTLDDNARSLRVRIDQAGGQGLSAREIMDAFPQQNFYALTNWLGNEYENIVRQDGEYYRRTGLPLPERLSEAAATDERFRRENVLPALRERIDRAGSRGVSAQSIFRAFPRNFITIIAELGGEYETVGEDGQEHYRRRGSSSSESRRERSGGRHQSRDGGPRVYWADAESGMANGLLRAISDRRAQIAVDLTRRFRGPVDRDPLQAAYENDSELRSLQRALAARPTNGLPADGDVHGDADRLSGIARGPSTKIDERTGHKWVNSSHSDRTRDGRPVSEPACVSVALIYRPAP